MVVSEDTAGTEVGEESMITVTIGLITEVMETMVVTDLINFTMEVMETTEDMGTVGLNTEVTETMEDMDMVTTMDNVMGGTATALEDGVMKMDTGKDATLTLTDINDLIVDDFIVFILKRLFFF